VLKTLGKTYEFHRYDGCGHAFFNTFRPSYRPEQALDGWNKVFAFLKKNLANLIRCHGRACPAIHVLLSEYSEERRGCPAQGRA
jgi:hypothetical protein